MNVARRLHTLVAMAVFFGPACYGATIGGTVKGPDGAPVAGAFVEAQNGTTKITTIGVSDKQGNYRVEKLPAGEYVVRIKAVGLNIDPKDGVKLTADQNASFDFALQKGTVHWNDLSIYQAGKLLPTGGSGKEMLFSRCFICHGFQTRMASVTRDADGWKGRVQYMRDAMKVGVSDSQAATLSTYLTSIFGPDSALSKSPADMPDYKDTLRNYPDTSTNIAFVEYDMPAPNRMPFSAAPAKDGTVWIPDFGSANKITRLHPDTGKMEEYAVPNEGPARVHSAVPAADGSVWLTEQESNKLGRWDPTTQKITEYQDAYLKNKDGGQGLGEKHTVRIDGDGNAWATGSPLTRLNPETGKYTRWDEIPHLYGMVIDKDANIWFTKHDTSQIGKINYKDKDPKVTLYTPPNHNVPLYGVRPDPDGSIRSYPRRIALAPDGMVWFGEFNAGYAEKFDPKSETFTEYKLPGPEATPYGFGFDADGAVWYSSYNQDVLGRLDPKTGKVTEYPFPHSENTIREFFLASDGKMWYGSPANNKVGYFYLTNPSGKKGSSGN